MPKRRPKGSTVRRPSGIRELEVMVTSSGMHTVKNRKHSLCWVLGVEGCRPI